MNKKELVSKLYNEMSNLLIDENLKLIKLVKTDQFEDASLMRDDLNLKIYLSSLVFASIFENNTDDNYNQLLNINKEIYDSLLKNYEKYNLYLED